MRLSHIQTAAVLSVLAIVATGRLDAAKNQKNKAGRSATETTVDLNTASRADLEKLPGIGRSTAAKIISHRPYNSIDDLTKAGVPQKTIDQIRPMVSTGTTPSPKESATSQKGRTRRYRPLTDENTAGAPTNPAPARSRSSVDQNRQDTTASPRASTPPTDVAGDTKVWVNTDTGVFHTPGDQWYGKTKHGKYMTADEAQKAGYRAAKHK